MTLLQMQHDVDPKQALIDSLGDLSGVDISANKVLVAVYIRPEKTKSGLYLSSKTIDEDRYQGKVGLIVKKGPLAFDPTDILFQFTHYQMHDWVFFRPSDGWSITVNGVLCRILKDDQIVGKTASCDDVW